MFIEFRFLRGLGFRVRVTSFWPGVLEAERKQAICEKNNARHEQL